MPLPGLSTLSPDADLNTVKNYIIRLERKLSFLLENGLDTDNIFEAGGWRVGEHQLASKNGDVGMSTADDAPDPVRLWAGSTNKNAAPWRVYKSGKSVMTGALIQSSDGSYPLVKMDPTSALFGAYTSENKYISMVAMDGSYSAPALLFQDRDAPAYAIMYVNAPSREFDILVAGRMYITAEELRFSGSRLGIDSWNTLYNVSAGQTLQQSLDGKASQSDLNLKLNASYAATSLASNMAFDPGTRNLKLYSPSGITLATVNIP